MSSPLGIPPNRRIDSDSDLIRFVRAGEAKLRERVKVRCSSTLETKMLRCAAAAAAPALDFAFSYLMVYARVLREIFNSC